MRHGFDLILNRTSTAVSAVLPLLGNVLLVGLMVFLFFLDNIDLRPHRLIALFDFHVKHVKLEDPARTLMVDSWMDVDVRYMKRLPVMNIFRNQAQQVQAVALTRHFWSSFT